MQYNKHFPKRVDGDRLDVIPLLQQGLARCVKRCVVACEGRAVSASEMHARAGNVRAQLREASVRSGGRVAVMLWNSDEAHRIGLVHHIVREADVLKRLMEIAYELGMKSPVAMGLDKTRFREMTELSFPETIAAAIRARRQSYETNEPQRMVEAFYKARGGELPA